MKKYFIMMLMGLMFAVSLVGLTQSSASAAGCGNQTHKSSTMGHDIGEGSDWTVNFYLYYRNCTNDAGTKYVLIDKIQFVFNRHADGEGGCGPVSAFQGNPDGIGGWNPVGKIQACSSDNNYVMTWWAPDNLKVWVSDSNDGKCTTPNVTWYTDWPGYNNVTKNGNSLCVIDSF